MTDTLDRVAADDVAPDAGPPAAELPADPPPRGLLAAAPALAVGILGFRLGHGGDPLAAVITAVAVLVAGCPVAVLLAPRVLRHAGVRRARRIGVALTAAELGTLGRVDTVALRRTGLVVTGRAELAGLTVAAGESTAEVLRLAGAVERQARHPFARVVTAAATAAGPLPDVAEFDALPGQGVRGLVAELAGFQIVAHAVLVGSPVFLREHDVDLPDDLAAARDEIEAVGHAAVVVAWDGVARAVLDLAEQPRPGAAAALAAIARCGVRPVLVTGTGRAVAEAQAARLGLAADQVIAEVEPDRRADVLSLLLARGRIVAGAGTSGGLVELPVAPHGPAGVADAVRLAVRVRRVGSAVRVLATAVAVAGALTALADPIAAVTAPGAGLVIVAAARLAVALSGTARSRRGPPGPP